MSILKQSLHGALPMIALVVLLVPFQTHGQLFQCKDADGKTGFQDRPCDGRAEGQSHELVDDLPPLNSASPTEVQPRREPAVTPPPQNTSATLSPASTTESKNKNADQGGYTLTDAKGNTRRVSKSEYEAQKRRERKYAVDN